MFEEIGDRMGKANSLWALGDLLCEEANYQPARECY